MRILISNDDGITAPGIRALAHALADAGHRVWVVAPDRERSAHGHALTLGRPLSANAVALLPPDEGQLAAEVAGAWAVGGTPADCVKLALDALLSEPMDLVCTGINRGPNLGTDVLYSGTVAAALEGVLNGVPAIAFSLDSFTDEGYARGARFAASLVGQLEGKRPWPKDMLLNVNLPKLMGEGYAGVASTRLGVRRYADAFERRRDPRGRIFYWLAGEAMDLPDIEEADTIAVQQNLVSITPLQADMTRHSLMGELKGLNLGL